MAAKAQRKRRPPELTVDQRAELVGCEIVARWSPHDQEDFERVYPRDELALRRLYGKRPPGPATQRNVAYRLDAFLRFHARICPGDRELPLSAKVTPESLLLYGDEFDGEETIHEYLDDIVRYAKRSDPTLAIVALRNIVRQFQPRRKGRSRRPTFDAFETFVLAESKLMALEAEITRTAVRGAIARDKNLEAYRNLFVVASLCLLPLRLRNITEMEVGLNVKPVMLGYRVSFPAESMKARSPYNDRLPDRLVARYAFYLKHVRPFLAPSVDPKKGRLILSFRGTGMTAIGIHQIINRVTRLLIGQATSAHAFRHAYGDTAARAGVQLSSIAKGLQHAPNSPVTESYVKDRNMKGLAMNRARMAERLRKYQPATPADRAAA